MSFRYRGSTLYADGVPLRRLAELYGTPLYIYSQSMLLENYRQFQRAFRRVPHLICFALKANSSHRLLQILAEEGSGADIVSGGELYRALRAGYPASRIVFAGVGKTEPEIAEALRKRILMLNVESGQELDLIQRIAKKMKQTAPIGLRVNPDINAETHPYISTGLRLHKFGVPFENAPALYRKAASHPNINVIGIHMHLGSQILKAAPFHDAVQRLVNLSDLLRQQGIPIRYLDMGGGFGISYENHTDSLSPAKVAAQVIPLLRHRDLTLILEPGRSIVGDAGVLLTEVLYTKRSGSREFVIVDAGMNDLIRPSLYNAYHEIVPVRKRHGQKKQVDVVGPVCETGDFLALERNLQPVEPGDLLAVLNAGAYGFSMSSQYNSRPRAAEVLVKESMSCLIRRRETVTELIRQETRVPNR